MEAGPTTPTRNSEGLFAESPSSQALRQRPVRASSPGPTPVAQPGWTAAGRRPFSGPPRSSGHLHAQHRYLSVMAVLSVLMFFASIAQYYVEKDRRSYGLRQGKNCYDYRGAIDLEVGPEFHAGGVRSPEECQKLCDQLQRCNAVVWRDERHTTAGNLCFRRALVQEELCDSDPVYDLYVVQGSNPIAKLQIYSLVSHPAFFLAAFMTVRRGHPDWASWPLLTWALLAALNLSAAYAWSMIPGKGMGMKLEGPRTAICVFGVICVLRLMQHKSN